MVNGWPGRRPQYENRTFNNLYQPDPLTWQTRKYSINANKYQCLVFVAQGTRNQKEEHKCITTFQNIKDCMWRQHQAMKCRPLNSSGGDSGLGDDVISPSKASNWIMVNSSGLDLFTGAPGLVTSIPSQGLVAAQVVNWRLRSTHLRSLSCIQADLSVLTEAVTGFLH